MLKRFFASVVVFLVCFMCQSESVTASMPIDVKVQPNQILIGASYNGTEISVSGEIPADTEAFIRVTGGLEDSSLKKKGRALGVLWMNLGAVTFHNVPSVFLIYPSNGTEKEGWEALALGLEAVKKKAAVMPASEDKDLLFKEFVKLKQSFGLYGTVENAIHYKEKSSDTKSFTGGLSVPSDLPVGAYRIQVYAIGGGVIEGYGTQEIEAKEVGMPAFISSLAFNHGTLYGVLAVLVALIAGLLTGIIFKGGGEAH